MKRVYICMVLFGMVVFISVFSTLYIRSTAEKISEAVRETVSLYKDGDYAAAEEAAARAESQWLTFRERDFLLGDKQQVTEITASLAKIKALAEESQSETIAECHVALALIELYKRRQI